MNNQEVGISYYIDRSQSIRKSVIIYKISGSIHSPIMYLQKPKWITDEEFSSYLDRMQIMIKPEID